MVCVMRNRRHRIAIAVTGALAALGILAATAQAYTSYEPFVNSYWRKPSHAPADPHSGAYISWLSSQVHNKFVILRATGMSGSSSQGDPIYYPSADQPRYTICHNPHFKSYAFPPQATNVAIPTIARTDATDNDKDMIVYNKFDDRVYWFTEMQKINGRWCAFQMSVYNTKSNGIEWGVRGSNNKMNWGHHGVSPITQAVRYGEVGLGRIPHVLEVYIPNIGCHSAVWLLDGNTYCTSHSTDAIPAGAILRIKPGVNLSRISLNPTARIIAQALQTYGAIVGDHSGTGNSIAIKLEDTVTEGRGNLWAERGLNWESLSHIPLSDYQIDQLGYGR
jgi:hypothetical protein